MSQENQIINKKRKTDRRTLYTRKVIMESYIQLLKEKPREKIKITELCQLAEINRCTFYLHFEDINAVGQAIEQQMYEKFIHFIETQKPEVKKRQVISDCFMDAILHDDTYTTMMRMHNPAASFSNMIGSCYFEEMKAILPKGNHLTERKQEILYAFIVGGIAAVQYNWIENKNSDIKQENQFLDKLVHLLMSVNE